MSPTKIPTSYVLVAGVVLASLEAGGLLYAAVSGRLFDNLLMGHFGWLELSLALLFVYGAVMTRREPCGPAFGTFAAMNLLTLFTPLGGTTLAAWWMREGFHATGVVLLLWGGRRAARVPGMPLVMCLIVVTLLPFRYWTVKNWYDHIAPVSVVHDVR